MVRGVCTRLSCLRMDRMIHWWKMKPDVFMAAWEVEAVKTAAEDGCARSRYRPVMEMKLQRQPRSARWHRPHTQQSWPQCHSKVGELIQRAESMVVCAHVCACVCVYVCYRSDWGMWQESRVSRLPRLKTRRVIFSAARPRTPQDRWPAPWHAHLRSQNPEK